MPDSTTDKKRFVGGSAEAGSPNADSVCQRILHQAEQILYRHSYHYGSLVKFQYKDGVLTLRGQAPSFYLKQLAQTTLKELDGVHQIDNQLDVVRPIEWNGQ